MTTSCVVRARVDENIKREASRVLADIGLSLSDAIRVLLIRVASEKAMPFEVRVPNAETRKAMETARHGDVFKAKTTKAFITALNADD